MKSYIWTGIKNAYTWVWDFINEMTEGDEYISLLFRGLFRLGFILFLFFVIIEVCLLAHTHYYVALIVVGIMIFVFELLPRFAKLS